MSKGKVIVGLDTRLNELERRMDEVEKYLAKLDHRTIGSVRLGGS